MPRKKLPARKAADDDAVELTPELAQAPAHGRKVTVERRIYSEPLEPAEIPQVDTDDDAEDPPGFDYSMGESANDHLLDFFDESAGDDQHMLRVFQLVQPSKNLHFKGGGMIYRGEIPYAASFLRDVQENYGGGLFRLQVVGFVENPVTGGRRYKILKSRTLTIAAPAMPALPDQAQAQGAPLISPPNVPYLFPASPNGDQGPPPTVKENLAEVVAIVSMVDKLRGNNSQPEAPAQAPVDPEIAALQLISKNPEVMEKVATGIARTVLGDKAMSDDNKWADVAIELIKSGQGPEMLRVLIQEFMSPFRGPAQYPAQQYAQAQAPQQPPGQIPPGPGNQPMPPQPTYVQGPPPGAEQPQAGADPGMLPEDHALMLTLQLCARRAPPQVACNRLLEYAGMLNNDAPQYSIDDYLDMFISMTPDDALAFVRTQRGGEAVAAMPHAREWTEQLQTMIKQQMGAQQNAN